MKLLKSTLLTSLVALFPVACFADSATLFFNVQASALGLTIMENHGVNGSTLYNCPGEVSFLNHSMSFSMPLSFTSPSNIVSDASVTLDNFNFNGTPVSYGICTTGSATKAGILGASVNPSGSPVVPIFTYTQAGSGATFTLTAEESSAPQSFTGTDGQQYNLTECIGSIVHGTTYYACNYTT